MSRANSKDERDHFDISDNHSSDDGVGSTKWMVWRSKADVLSPSESEGSIHSNEDSESSYLDEDNSIDPTDESGEENSSDPPDESGENNSSDPTDESGEEENDDGLNEEGGEDLDALPQVQKSLSEVNHGIELLRFELMGQWRKRGGGDVTSVKQELGLYLKRRDELLTLERDTIIELAAKRFINAVGQEGYHAAAFVFKDAKEGKISLDTLLEFEKAGMAPSGTVGTSPTKNEGTEEEEVHQGSSETATLAGPGPSNSRGQKNIWSDWRMEMKGTDDEDEPITNNSEQQQPPAPPPREELGGKALSGPAFRPPAFGPRAM